MGFEAKNEKVNIYTFPPDSQRPETASERERLHLLLSWHRRHSAADKENGCESRDFCHSFQREALSSQADIHLRIDNNLDWIVG
jgi:hypothetical protein